MTLEAERRGRRGLLRVAQDSRACIATRSAPSRCRAKSPRSTTPPPLLLRVVDQPVRVLLLEGKPYWDTKFLVRTLSADQSIELTSVVQLAEGRLLQRKIAAAAPADDATTSPPRAKDESAATADRDRRRRSREAMDHREGCRQVPLRCRRAGLLSDRDSRPQRRGLSDRRRPGEAAEVAGRERRLAGLLPRSAGVADQPAAGRVDAGALDAGARIAVPRRS